MFVIIRRLFFYYVGYKKLNDIFYLDLIFDIGRIFLEIIVDDIILKIPLVFF